MKRRFTGPSVIFALKNKTSRSHARLVSSEPGDHALHANSYYNSSREGLPVLTASIKNVFVLCMISLSDVELRCSSAQ